MVCVLPKDTDDRSPLGSELGRGVHNFEGAELVIVDTSDVNFAHVDVNDDGIVADDTTVGTSIHEGTAFLACVFAYAIHVAGNRTNCNRRHHAFGLVRCPVGYGNVSYVCVGLEGCPS